MGERGFFRRLRHYLSIEPTFSVHRKINALQRRSTTFRKKFVSRKNEGKTARAKNSGFILERTVLFDNTHIPILWDVDERSALPRMFANLRNCWSITLLRHETNHALSTRSYTRTLIS